MPKYPACGNAPALPRRTVLACGPLLVVGLSSTATPTQALESEIQPLFQQWATTRTAASSGTEAECDAAVDRLTELEEQICALPSRSAADFAAKIVAWSSWGDFGLPEEDHPIWAEARALLS